MISCALWPLLGRWLSTGHLEEGEPAVPGDSEYCSSQATPAVAAPAVAVAAAEEAPMFAALRARVTSGLDNGDDQPALERIIAATQEPRRTAAPPARPARAKRKPIPAVPAPQVEHAA